tara:strand:- start:7360 stop:8385 length:1026 start_codon:yes stop_codon:yes gene_type:complete
MISIDLENQPLEATSETMFVFADHGINEKLFLSVETHINEFLRNKIKDSSQKIIHPHTCFGHDLHISRIIVFDMLNNEIINNRDVLIVDDDRQFLYNQTFPNVINFKNFILKYQNKVNDNNLVFLPHVVEDLLYCRTNNSLMKYNYDVYNELYWNNKLIEKIKNISKFKLDVNFQNMVEKDKFIIFIVRSFNHREIDIQYVDYIKKLMDVRQDFKVILFCAYPGNLQIKGDYIINNIQELSTLLLCNNCTYLIGETSGLLEMSYYYHHDDLNIFQFPGEYKLLPALNTNNKKNYQENWLGLDDFKKNIASNWGKKHISPIKHYFFFKFDDIIKEMKIAMEG